MDMKRRISIVIVALFAVAGVLLLANTFFGRVLQPAYTRSGTATIGGPFTLVATNGQNVSDQTYRGKWMLIYFGYTSCPDACPTALTMISAALGKLGADADKLQALFVTVDPQRDTRQVMADYIKSFDPRILGLTGTQAEIDRVIKEYHLYVSRDKSDSSGDYLVSHSSYIYLVGPNGKFVNVIQGNEGGEQIAAWLRKEMAQTGA